MKTVYIFELRGVAQARCTPLLIVKTYLSYMDISGKQSENFGKKKREISGKGLIPLPADFRYQSIPVPMIFNPDPSLYQSGLIPSLPIPNFSRPIYNPGFGVFNEGYTLSLH